MTYQERARIVARLLAGTTPVRPGGSLCHVREATAAVRFLAEEAYWDALEQASDALSEADALALAGWDERQQSQLERAESDLDDLKVSLYESWLNGGAREKAFQRLARCRQIIFGLAAKKNEHKHLTGEHIARGHKTRVLVGLSLYTPAGQRLLGDDPDLWHDNLVLDEVVKLYSDARPSESQMRELARTSPWQAYWSAAGARVFGVPAAEWSEDRLSLANLSLMYDRVRESPDRPSQDVIECDDALDGWLIVQKRKGGSTKEDEQRRMIGSEKIANCGEVYVMTGGDEEARRRVESWNSYLAKKDIAQRMKILREKGRATENDFPDVRQEIDAKRAELEARQLRGG